jgi:hypothetical protein
MAALAPALLLLVVACAGGLWTGATALGAVVVGLAVAAAVAASAGRLAAPLGPGSGWVSIVLPAAWLIATLHSAVPRAALGSWVVLPSLLVVPSLVAAACERGSRVVAGAIGASASLLGTAALAEAMWSGGPVAMPLGHHLLLAGVLLGTWPAWWLATVGWSWSTRALGAAPAVVAIIATESIAALLLLGVQIAWLARTRRWAAVAIAVAGIAAIGGARLVTMVQGVDLSTLARWRYLEAGWRGVLDSPWWGHGPGSTAWLIGNFGAAAPGELVGDLHSAPLTMAFELGLVGLTAILLVACAVLRRCRWGSECAPLIGIAGFLLLEPTFSSPAPWIVLSVTVGLALAPHPAPGSWRRWLGPAVAAVLCAVAGPVLLGQWFWDRAVTAADAPTALSSLRRAAALDPAHPLYAWRLAIETGDARAAAAAATRADGIAALHLGAAGLEPGGVESLARARRLDPEDPFAAWLEVHEVGDRAEAAEPLAVALRGEPRLLAAPAILLVPEAARAAIARLLADPTLEPGWRTRLRQVAGVIPAAGDGLLRRRADAEAATSLSVLQFRRRPWPVDLVQVPVDLELAVGLGLEPAARVAGESR